MFKNLGLLLLLLLPLWLTASHLRSGEISYRWISGTTYEITVVVYTNASPGIVADLTSVDIYFGDGTSANVSRGNGPAGFNNTKPPVYCQHLGDLNSPTIRKNIYTTTHTYATNGSFVIYIAPSARNLNVINLPAGNFSLYTSAMLTIGAGLAPLSSPQLSFPPIGDGCINTIYKINPGATDPNGDLLDVKLISCRTASAAKPPVPYDIPGYKFPQDLDPSGRTQFTMDPKTGVITWDKPTMQGEYNIAFRIEKYRAGVLVGYVDRDMQVTILPCLNNPPNIKQLPDTCVEAGTTLSYKITSSDPDGDTLTFVTTGTPYDLTISPATYTADSVPIGETSGTFTWKTNVAHFRRNPYQVYYKVSDSHKGSSLTDVTSNFITIMAPPITNVNATIFQRGFKVTWGPAAYPTATGYNIYRRLGSSAFVTDPCSQGVPAGSGFSLVGTVTNPAQLSYIDNNNGKGLISGSTYCYVVTATFPDGAESPASQPFCSTLMIPFIHVFQDTLVACQGNTVTIDSTVVRYENADPASTFLWSAPAQIELSNSSTSEVSARLITPGLYPLKLVAHSGLYTDSTQIMIKVYPIPTPVIKLQDLGGMPDSVMFYNRSPNSVRAIWTFPDGTVSSDHGTVLYAFEKNGYFRIYLKVFNILGCPDTTSIVYRVVMKGVAMPNAFEPENPNSKLNKFRPVALGLQTYYLGVWDLWGNKVWESDKLLDTVPADGWDGTDRSGKKMPAQTYIWRMQATFIDGKVWQGVKDHFGKLHKEGTFTLLR